MTRTTWAQHALDAYRPLFQHLAGTLGAASAASTADLGGEADEPGLAMFGGLMQMLSPMMLGMSVGSMVGHLSRRSFGQYDLPIPRPASPEVHVVSATIDAFSEAWSLPIDDLRLWVSLQEIASHAVLTIPHVRAELESLLMSYVAGFQPEPGRPGRQAGRPRPDRRQRPGRSPARARRSGGAARCHAVAGPAGAAPAARRPRRHHHRLRGPHRGLSGARPRGHRPAHRRGGPAPPGGVRPVRHLRRAAARPDAHAGGGGAGRTRSWPACSSARATWGGCGSRSTCCPRRPRSTPRASGWPASTSDRTY